MSFNANDRSGGGDFTPQEALEPGIYPARVVQLVLMGVQPQRPFKGVAKEPKEELYVGYELSHEFMKDEDGNPEADKPRWVGENFPFYNLEADRATSTARYNAIDPTGVAGGDWVQLMGHACQVTLTKEPRKDGKGDTNYVSHVAAAMQVPGYEQPALVNAPRIFDWDNPDMEVFKQLPRWLQERLKGATNFNGSKLQAALEGGEDGTTTTTAAPAPAPAPAPAAPAPAAASAPAAPAAPVAPPPAPAAPPAPPAPPSE